MSPPGRAHRTPSQEGRSARRTAAGTRPGVGRGGAAWVLWSVPLVLLLVVIAASLWGMNRRPGGDPLARPAASTAEGASRTFVSLTFDDGDKSQELAGQLMRSHGLHGTFYINTGLVDAENAYFMTWPQILRLHAEGHDIGGHTSTHINLTDPAIPEPVKRQEVCQDRQRLQEMELDPQSFAYPYGAVDDTAAAIVESCGYRWARSGGGLSPDGPQFAEDVPPQVLTTSALHTPPGPMSVDYLQRAVLAAAERGGGWVPIIFHRICSPNDPDFHTCMSGESPIESRNFIAFLDWLQRAAPDGTAVRTVRDVVNAPA